MQNVNAALFSKVSGFKVDEIVGDCLISIEPGTYCVFNHNIPSNWPHYHSFFYELCFVTGGLGEFWHGDKIYTLQEGDVFVANPECIHEIRLKKDENGSYSGALTLVFFRLNLHVDTLSKTPRKQHYDETMLKKFLSDHSIICRAQNYLFSYLKFIESYTQSGFRRKYGLEQVVKNMALEGLFSLVNHQENQEMMQIIANPIIDLAVNYISANLHRKIYLHEIAASACTSERNLQYIFKKRLHKTVFDYINCRKASVAAGYLKMNFSISDSCNLIGINDVAQFSRLFKKYYGMSPKRYQKIYSTDH